MFFWGGNFRPNMAPKHPPPKPAGSRDTLVVEEESLILQQVGDANKADKGNH